MTAILETSRLRLREFRLADLDDLAPMVADDEQMRFYAGPRSRDEARAWVQRNIELYARHGFGFWLIESRETSAFLGYCGIRPLTLDGIDETEIGWHTKKTSWNLGIATEAATAVKDLAQQRFGRTRLVALIRPGHEASFRVAQKIGMRERGTAVVEGHRYFTYVVDADDG